MVALGSPDRARSRASNALLEATEAQLAPRRNGVGREDAAIETWMIGLMAYEVLVDIAVFRDGAAERKRVIDAFIRVFLRMLGYDPRL